MSIESESGRLSFWMTIRFCQFLMTDYSLDNAFGHGCRIIYYRIISRNIKMVTKWRKKFMDNALGLGCRINPGKWSRMNQIDAEGQRFQLWEVLTSMESNRQQDRLGLIRVLNLISGVYFPWKSYISSPRQWLVLIYTISFFLKTFVLYQTKHLLITILFYDSSKLSFQSF